mgnify:CR=1 FL=1
MESRRILKVLSNGWEVPYPNEVIYRGMLLLKDYRLNGYPENAVTNGIDYDSYMEWLQDYLLHCRIDLTEEQCKLRDQISTDKYFDGAFLGWHAGFYENSRGLHPQYNFPEDFDVAHNIDHLAGIVDDDPYTDYLPKCISTRQGHKIEYLEMNAALSKVIIDEIDRALAKHYGFTGEELDFIINYDIKYRMGNADDETGDDE